MQLLTCTSRFAVNECVEAVAVHPLQGVGTVWKLVAGSADGVRRQREFLFGGGQQSLWF
jgi:hypothetical protein